MPGKRNNPLPIDASDSRNVLVDDGPTGRAPRADEMSEAGQREYDLYIVGAAIGVRCASAATATLARAACIF
jgi:hypothetical protein